MKNSILKIFLFLLLAILLISQMVVQTGCANIVPPEGGPRDTLPPELIKASPPDYSTNFSENRIIFSFNEYVDIDNYQQNLIISPVPVNMPTITRKLSTVTIKLRDTLEPNTTYLFDFGKSIKDVNEGNIMKDFKYVFSTGRYVDSLQFSGKVVLAETGETDSTITAMLHKKPEDSAVVKEHPRYISKLDGKGNFIFHNLSPGIYYVYALKDEGGSHRYSSKKQLFAFADSAIIVGQKTDPLKLYAYAEEKEDNTGASNAASAPQSSRTNRRGAPGLTDKRLKFQTNLDAGTQDLLNKFAFIFEVPLKNFDSSKIHFTTDTTFAPVQGYHWQTDSTMKRVELIYSWQENTVYNFVLEKDFATDTLGQQLLRGDTLSFRTKTANDYGKVSIRFRNIDLSKNPVVQFLQSGTITTSFPLTSETITQNMFIPGDYNLRILYDKNKNGKWDPGEFFGTRRQPELVIPIERKITIRPRWANDFEIAL